MYDLPNPLPLYNLVLNVCSLSLYNLVLDVSALSLASLWQAGMQQVQVDMHYLRPRLRRFTGGSSAAMVDAVMEEAVTAAAERSDDPTLLEHALLERLAQQEASRG